MRARLSGRGLVIYAHGQPGRLTAPVRALERAAARLRGSDLLLGAAFGGHPVDGPRARRLIKEAELLLGQAAILGSLSARARSSGSRRAACSV